MAHSKVRMWVHVVFCTKYRRPFITPSVKAKMYQLLCEELLKKRCRVEVINGMPDHVHLLLQLDTTKSIANVIHQCKGASSFKINQEQWFDREFNWSVGYGAFSVSQSLVSKVRNYIINQENHHEKTKFKEEYNRLLKLHGLEPEDEKWETDPQIELKEYHEM